MVEMIWTLLSIFVIAPLGALAFDRPLFGNWIWHVVRRPSRCTCGNHGVRPTSARPTSDGTHLRWNPLPMAMVSGDHGLVTMAG